MILNGETRTVDVHIRSLRQKLGNGGNLLRRSEESATGSEAVNNETENIEQYGLHRSCSVRDHFTLLAECLHIIDIWNNKNRNVRDDAAYLAASLNVKGNSI